SGRAEDDGDLQPEVRAVSVPRFEVLPGGGGLLGDGALDGGGIWEFIPKVAEAARRDRPLWGLQPAVRLYPDPRGGARVVGERGIGGGLGPLLGARGLRDVCRGRLYGGYAGAG